MSMRPIQCLVLERSTDIARDLRRAFDSTELLISQLESEGEAVQAIANGDSFEILFLDKEALGHEDLSFVAKWRKLTPGTLLILATNSPSLPSAVSSIRQGAFDYLAKPIDSRQLSSTTREAIETAKAYRLETKKRDITQMWKQDEMRSANVDKIDEELVQSEKLAYLGELAAGIAHDINTPLTGIVGFIGLFLRFLDQSQVSVEELVGVRHYLTNARAEALRCKEILNHILSFSRKESQEFQEFSLLEVIQRIRSIVEKQLEKANIQLTIEAPRELPKIRGSANKIQQVLMNLLVNAKRAMPEGGHIVVSVALRERQIQVAVGDSGIGIPEDRLAKIFEPFYTTNEKGTGLGLSISKKIVREHGGNILVKSEVGKGTTFTLVLPIP